MSIAHTFPTFRLIFQTFRRLIYVATPAIVCVMMHPAAHAAMVAVEFTGTIEAVSFTDPTGKFSPGQSIKGMWTVDTATIDTDAVATRGRYPQVGTPAFELEIGSDVFHTNSSTIQILNNHTLGIGTIDAYDVLGGATTSTISGLSIDQMQITLRDTQLPLGALSDDLLPLTAPDPAAFDQINQASGQLIGKMNNGQTFFLNLDIQTTQLVPEPASFGLCASMMLVMAGLFRRR